MGYGGDSPSEGLGPVAVVPDSLGAQVVRFTIRFLVVVASGVMGAGFLGWQAGVLVAVLVALSYLLLATLAPHLRAPFGRGRLLRTLYRNGYHVVPGGRSRHVAVGAGGVYLLETRTWQHAVSRNGDSWMIGALPADRAVERVGAHAARLERSLHLAENWPGVRVVPVITSVGRLPEPVMRSGRVVIARPRQAVEHILAQPTILDPQDVDDIAQRFAS
ncbi:hypothetical protein NI17_018365 [Thermobifida halotolerans]|uniref:Uncharacterized protein n=1 Tax=Thermobifida halotolerans TaxID=483545 RepID=A0A399FVA3_9ACTN|nr:hypothetical protein [Thermobifida halotolerans]UOE18733.1 hypothetical protein NI17_018365 [Thermobifida halotolerans]